MTVLYTNGCSYTGNQWVDQQLRYPRLISDHFGWDLVDHAQPGACNDRIIRCTMRDCIGLLAEQQPIVALVQLTHLARTEYAAGSDTTWKRWQDHHFESIKPNEPGLPPDVDAYLRSYLCLFDHQASMTKLLCDLVGLTAFFKQHAISYLIFNGPDELNHFQSEDFHRYLQQDENVLDLQRFNMLDLTGNQAHPDAAGMRIIADHFIQLLSDSRL